MEIDCLPPPWFRHRSAGEPGAAAGGAPGEYEPFSRMFAGCAIVTDAQSTLLVEYRRQEADQRLGQRWHCYECPTQQHGFPFSLAHEHDDSSGLMRF